MVWRLRSSLEEKLGITLAALYESPTLKATAPQHYFNGLVEPS